MTVEQIAEDQALEVGAVKAALLQGSDKYKAENQALGPKDYTSVFTPMEDRAAMRTIADLSTSAEKENVRLKAACYVHNEFMGRNDAAMRNKLQINVVVFNEHLKRARASKEAGRSKTIDVESVPA